MAEAVSLVSGIIAIQKLTCTVIGYLNEVSGAAEERQKLLAEIVDTAGLLYSLKDTEEQAQQQAVSTAALASLCGPDGALQKFHEALEILACKLRPASGLRKAGKALMWPFQKSEIRDVLNLMERQKSSFALAVQNDHFAVSRTIKSDVNALKDNVQNIGENLAAYDRRAVIDWFSPINPWIKHNEICDSRQHGSGQWMFKIPEFQSWLNTDLDILWFSGAPGAGKTFLTSVIIDFLESLCSSSTSGANGTSDIDGIAFLYCSYKDTQQTACNLIGCLIKQLVNRMQTIPPVVEQLYKQHSMRRTRPNISDLTQVLQCLWPWFKRIFFVVDALDECSQVDNIRSILLGTPWRMPVRLLVTSRPIESIRYDLHFYTEFSKKEISIKELSIVAQPDDIRDFVESKIEANRRLRNFIRNDPRLKGAILEATSKSARGMFLLVRLHLDLLSQKLTLEDVYNNLTKLPSAIDATYDEAMRRIADGGQEEEEFTSRIMIWILRALRPLEIGEIRQALAVTRGATLLNPAAIVDEETLLSVCGGLLVSDGKTSHVHLIHYTAQEYFEKRQDVVMAHSYITGICLTYLLSENVASVLKDETAQWDDQVKQLPFLAYSRSQWGSHYHLCDGVGVEDLAMKLLEDQSRILELSKHGSWTSAFGRTLTKGFVGVHIAALFNLPGLLCKLIAAFQPDINVKSMKGWTPLAIACSQRYTEIADYFLSLDNLDINAGHRTAYGTALHAAAASGDTQLVYKLLDKGIELHLTNSRGYTALHTAAESGQVQVAELLITKGCNLNARTDTGANALYLAIRSSSLPTFTYLIKRNSNINITALDLWTPLHEAALCNEKAMVEQLLDRGADRTQKTADGLTAFDLAQWLGRREIAKMLDSRIFPLVKTNRNPNLPIRSRFFRPVNSNKGPYSRTSENDDYAWSAMAPYRARSPPPYGPGSAPVWEHTMSTGEAPYSLGQINPIFPDFDARDYMDELPESPRQTQAKERDPFFITE